MLIDTNRLKNILNDVSENLRECVANIESGDSLFTKDNHDENISDNLPKNVFYKKFIPLTTYYSFEEINKKYRIIDDDEKKIVQRLLILDDYKRIDMEKDGIDFSFIKKDENYFDNTAIIHVGFSERDFEIIDTFRKTQKILHDANVFLVENSIVDYITKYKLDNKYIIAYHFLPPGYTDLYHQFYAEMPIGFEKQPEEKEIETALRQIASTYTEENI